MLPAYFFKRLRNVDELTSASRRIDLGQVCSIWNHKSWRNSELFQYVCDFRSGKYDLKLWCIVGEVISSTFLTMVHWKNREPDNLSSYSKWLIKNIRVTNIFSDLFHRGGLVYLWALILCLIKHARSIVFIVNVEEPHILPWNAKNIYR